MRVTFLAAASYRRVAAQPFRPALGVHCARDSHRADFGSALLRDARFSSRRCRAARSPRRSPGPKAVRSWACPCISSPGPSTWPSPTTCPSAWATMAWADAALVGAERREEIAVEHHRAGHVTHPAWWVDGDACRRCQRPGAPGRRHPPDRPLLPSPSRGPHPEAIERSSKRAVTRREGTSGNAAIPLLPMGPMSRHAHSPTAGGHWFVNGRSVLPLGSTSHEHPRSNRARRRRRRGSIPADGCGAVTGRQDAETERRRADLMGRPQ